MGFNDEGLGAAMAQSANEGAVKRLERRLDQLEQRIIELETRDANP